MINLINKGKQLFKGIIAQHWQLPVNTEDEDLAMSCGAFNPRFLARIKRSKADNKK